MHRNSIQNKTVHLSYTENFATGIVIDNIFDVIDNMYGVTGNIFVVTGNIFVVTENLTKNDNMLSILSTSVTGNMFIVTGNICNVIDR